MAQISFLHALPDPVFPIKIPASQSGSSTSNQKTAASTSTQPSDVTEASPLQSQLTRLSSVLNSLQLNASNHRAQYVQAFEQVKAGTYHVDPLKISQSLVSDTLKNK